MDAVLDLTARAVAFISYLQDVLQFQEPTYPADTFTTNALVYCGKDKLNKEVKAVLSGNDPGRRQFFFNRAEELVVFSLPPESREKEEEHPKEVEKQILLKVEGLQKWLHGYQDELKKLVELNHAILNKKNCEEDIPVPEEKPDGSLAWPAPAEWRAAIRELLFQKKESRFTLAAALQYLPQLVVLALGWEEEDYAAQQARLKDEAVMAEINRLLQEEGALIERLKKRKVPLPFGLILEEELEEIIESRKLRNAAPGNPSLQQDPYKVAEGLQLRGLAFSGGGIRSATFNLGVLQGLAQANLLSSFDYLSTVSGGGYIGSWFSAWVKREGSMAKVQDRLNPDTSNDPMADEVRPIRWLRMFSNYLSPNSSIMSTDSWTMGLTWLRNTLLTQLILVLLLGSGLALGAVCYGLWQQISWTAELNETELFFLSASLVLPVAVAAGLGMQAFNRRRPSWSRFSPTASKALVYTLVGISVVISFFISAWFYYGDPLEVIPQEPTSFFPGINRDSSSFLQKMAYLAPVAMVSFLGLVSVAVIGKYHDAFPASTSRKIKAGNFGLLIMASAFAALFGLALLVMTWDVLRGMGSLRVQHFTGDYSRAIAFTLGVPLVLEVLCLTVVMRMALMGLLFPDERREWWGRMGALVHRVALVWLLLVGAALLGGDLVQKFYTEYGKTAVATAGGWFVVVGLAVRMAFSSNTSGDPDSPPKGFSVGDFLVRVAPYLFGLGLLILVSKAIYFILLSFGETGPGNFFLERGLLLFAILLVLTLLFTWRVGVNEFSMHHFYRNRLVRAYLGATRRRTDRKSSANNFTGFDKLDDLQLACLVTKEGYQGPFPIINTTLNATIVSDLDRQDRKGESFVFTPLYCGFDISRTCYDASLHPKNYNFAFRPTSQFASLKGGGPSLGTAMAISGAAANPNQGHHSSPATAFLLTSFNARLGWWMGNPLGPAWQNSDPSMGLSYILYDLMGKSDTDKNYVCLSDGGHFDNMGLYELVRRRCRLIVLSDAEEDASFTCEGLANAIRRCRIDFGVEICIEVSKITDRDEKKKLSPNHFSLGRIWYPGDPAQEPSGILIYLKSSLTGDEPADVKEYAKKNPRFPHQSTGDQFFNESQFESYRRLGLHLVAVALETYPINKLIFPEPTKTPFPADLEEAAAE